MIDSCARSVRTITSAQKRLSGKLKKKMKLLNMQIYKTGTYVLKEKQRINQKTIDNIKLD